ncbi:helix-turn-helix transcriptional regulator [Robiginitalea aurantiaca]|uniref:LuxR C-terminal-related transcriptional regulator n=1 Tax=Robiginitalea aurantiaca TaxID=3056915 RepID=A0ABT7WDA1_9FLAO|nr:LuxR C-terminal-related transcriptional regulator [Robiginitalea aurantiaca]MDM9630900.1 LuxR C-terminal-related transcriptional regulator [Robiginitalea aurantiaca]
MLEAKRINPFQTPNILERPRIIELLDRGAAKPFILVSAPAGFGKSVAVRHWSKQQKKSTAWVTLGAPHNNLKSFVSFLVAAFRQTNSGGFQKTLALSRNRNGRSLSDIVDVLSHEINALGKAQLLVLDDYHNIQDPGVHFLMQSLLEHPPGNLKIVLITRSDPPLRLSGLRLYDRLFDISKEDLRFTAGEVGLLLETGTFNRADYKLKDALVDAGGWILGIKMMLSAYSLNPNELTKYRREADMEYLVGELCGELSSEYFDALCLSTLLESFTAELLDVLFEATQKTKIRGSAFIEEFMRLDLFLMEDEVEKGWFRFQNLFRKLIRSQCRHEESAQKMQVFSLTSKWLERNGYLNEAIEYAVAVGNWELAVAQVSTHRVRIFEKGEWWRIDSWIQKLPVDIIHGNQILLLSLMWINEFTWKIWEIPKLLIRFENLGNKKGLAPRYQAEYEAHLGHHYLFYQSDPSTALDYLETSKSRFQDTGMLGGTRELCIGIARQMTEGKEQALEGLDILEKNSPSQSPVYLRSLMTKVFVQLLSADFKKAQWESNRFYVDAGNSSYPSFRAWSHYLAGNIDFQYGGNAALKHFEDAAEYEDSLNNRILIDALAAIALTFAMDNDEFNAWRSLEKLKNKAVQFKDPYLALVAKSAEKRIQLIYGKADMALNTPLPEYESQAMEMFCLVDVPKITGIRVAVSKGGHKEIRHNLKRIEGLLKLLHLAHNFYHDTDLYLLRALGNFRIGKLKKAQKWLAQASLSYSSTQNLRAFNEISMSNPEFYAWAPASHLPYGFNKRQGIPMGEDHKAYIVAPDLKSRLTKRELEIARLVALGLRNKEVSEDLNIREVTVKTHLTNIFQKLGVQNRTALARMTDFH